MSGGHGDLLIIAATGSSPGRTKGRPQSHRGGGLDVRAALATASARLAAISATPRLDAELLMAHALGVEREDLLLNQIDGPVPAAFDVLVQRRLAHEPVAYI